MKNFAFFFLHFSFLKFVLKQNNNTRTDLFFQIFFQNGKTKERTKHRLFMIHFVVSHKKEKKRKITVF